VCIAAVEKLVSEVGAFLSPYLGQILDQVLLRPAVLTSAATARAAAVRVLLAEKVPPRLLLDPVIQAYDGGPCAGGRVGGRSRGPLRSSCCALQQIGQGGGRGAP
jgi:hypothetical protein